MPLFKMKAMVPSHRVVSVQSKMHKKHLAQCCVADVVGDPPALHSREHQLHLQLSNCQHLHFFSEGFFLLLDQSCCPACQGPTCQGMNIPPRNNPQLMSNGSCISKPVTFPLGRATQAILSCSPSGNWPTKCTFYWLTFPPCLTSLLSYQFFLHLPNIDIKYSHFPSTNKWIKKMWYI